ncbi:hypothetical protein GCM10009692_14440 [Leucobacter aridicollis]
MNAMLNVLPAQARVARVGAAIQLTILTDVRESIDMGAHMGASRDHVVCRAAAIGTHHVAMAPRQHMPELRMVRRLRHPDAQLSR